MENRIITILIAFFLLSNAQVKAKGLLGDLCGLFGIKNETVRQIADAVDDSGIIQSAVVKEITPIMNQYGNSQAVQNYENSAKEWNRQQKEKVNAYLSEKDQWIADYCKKNGFYDLWTEQYKEEWLKQGGIPWFKSQNELYKRNHDGDDLLPWHLREAPTTNYRNESFSNSLYEAVGIEQQNINRGTEWANAKNKHDKQNVYTDFIADITGELTGQNEFIDKFRQQAKIFNTYNSDIKKAKTVEEKQAAISKKNVAYANWLYNSYLEREDKQTRRLQELLPIKQQLKEHGYDDTLANEVAASIIAVQKSKELTDAEKTEWLRGLGFDNYQEVSQAVNEVLADNSATTSNAEATKIKAEEEAKRQAELQQQEAERKAVEERKKALQTLEMAKINGYAFDETVLSAEQKSTLDGIAETLNKYPDVKVFITGYTCEIGYKNINLKKGLKRAEAGKEYLIEKGIATERISVDSKGETQPLVPNVSSDNRKQNRRIEFVIK
jgi:outer membrane protein OmpA-like peptidoglycan-associated protein